MDKFIIVTPHKYTASHNILKNLEKLDLPKNAEIFETEKESIYNENIDKIIEDIKVKAKLQACAFIL